MGASLRIIGFHPLRLALTLFLSGGLRRSLSFPSFVVVAWRRSFGSIVFAGVQICFWWVVDGGSCPSPLRWWDQSSFVRWWWHHFACSSSGVEDGSRSFVSVFLYLWLGCSIVVAFFLFSSNVCLLFWILVAWFVFQICWDLQGSIFSILHPRS
jgi:hypothetical protein